MKYDDASWHYGQIYPDDIGPEAAATHIGMFLTWALLTGLGANFHVEDCPDNIPLLERRKITPGRFLIDYCDEKLTAEDLNEEGNAFAVDYYNSDGEGSYLDDYEVKLGLELPTLYHVKDNWENFDQVKPLIDARFADWRRSRSK